MESISPPSKSQDKSECVDAVVVGAGPAGLQLAVQLQSFGVSYRILDGADHVGAFFSKYPRSRRLISFNKKSSVFRDDETNLRWDWNSLLGENGSPRFTDYSKWLYPRADDLVTYLADFAQHHQIQVQFNERVISVEPHGDGYRVETSTGTVYECRYVVIATGVSMSNQTDIPGVETAETYGSADVSPESFNDKRVLIIGKGNSAIEVCDEAVESAALVHLASRHPVRLAHKSHHPGDLRVHQARMFDLYQMKMLHSILDCTIDSIKQEGDQYAVEVTYSHANGEQDVLTYDRVIDCCGFQFDASIFSPECRPDLIKEDRLPDMTPDWESTKRPGVFFAGTLMQVQDFRQAGSAFIDGFRYNVRTLSHLLRERYHGNPYPMERLDNDAGSLADTLCRRATTTSGLWVQFLQLCDVFVPNGDHAAWYQELPLKDIARRFGDTPSLWTMHFAWGRWDGDPFAIDRHPDAAEADRSVFLHPVVQHWSNGKVDAVHHLLEDLVGVYHPSQYQDVVRSHNGVPVELYHKVQHVDPLATFLAATGAAG